MKFSRYRMVGFPTHDEAEEAIDRALHDEFQEREDMEEPKGVEYQKFDIEEIMRDGYMTPDDLLLAIRQIVREELRNYIPELPAGP